MSERDAIERAARVAEDIARKWQVKARDYPYHGEPTGWSIAAAIRVLAPAEPEEVSEAMIERPRASQFIGWIADRFQEKHVPSLPREKAITMAVACLEFSEDDAPFGHPDYGWDRDGAYALADDEIHFWESAA